MERDIDFKKMLWRVAERWRFILIWMLLGAIGLGTFKYVRDARTIDSLNATTNASAEQIVQSLSPEELQAVEEARAVSRQLKAMQEYQNESVLIRLNPYNKHIAVLQYYVDTNYTLDFTSVMETDDTADIISSYLSYVNNGGVGNVLEASGEAEGMNELIVAETSETDSTGIFTIQVAGTDEAHAESLAGKVEQVISRYYNTVAENVGNHEITLINSYTCVVTDDDLNLKQLDIMNGITGLQTKLETLTATLNENQLKALNAELEEEAVSDEATATVETIQYTAQVSMRMVVLGAILGAFAGAFLVAAAYILSQKVKDAQEVEKIFGIRIYGAMKSNNRKRLLGCVDTWISKLQGKDIRSEEDNLEFLIMNLVMSCKKENVQNIFLTSSVDASGHEKKMLEKLVEELKKAGLTVECGGSVNRSAAAFKRMSEIENVVFWEKSNVTRYPDVEKEMRICKEQQAHILGIIMFE